MAVKNDATDIRQVIWSDRENNNEWESKVDNYAGTQKLQGVGNLVGLYKVLGQVLVLSETDAYVGRYIGAPFVYGFERAGNNCSPVHKNAVATTDRFAIWLGNRNFWMYDGTVKSIDSEVMDFIANDISRDNVSKIRTQTITAFSEIWWFYQSDGGTEVDSYVLFDYAHGHWATGKLDRTAGVDRGVYPNPIMVNPAGEIYEHEQRSVLVEGQAFAISGPLELDNGNRNMAVRYVFPDTQSQGDVQLTFGVSQMPTDPIREVGPFAYRNPISTTGVLGREIRMGVFGLTSQWEVGDFRFDVQEVGGGFR